MAKDSPEPTVDSAQVEAAKGSAQPPAASLKLKKKQKEGLNAEDAESAEEEECGGGWREGMEVKRSGRDRGKQ